MDLALEEWKIWRTWETAFQAGTVPHSTHPGFGGQDARYDWLKATVKARLAAIPRLSPAVRATFRAVGDATTSRPGELRTLEVEWEDVEAADAVRPKVT